MLIIMTHTGHHVFVVATLLGTTEFAKAVSSSASATACVKLGAQLGTKGKCAVCLPAECYRGYGGAHLQVFPWYGVL